MNDRIDGSAPFRPEAKFQHNVVLLIVGKLAAKLPLYEATRYAWRIDSKRAAAAEYILPVIGGVIQGAFVAERWSPATVENFPDRVPMAGRWGFDGHEAPPEIVALYQQKRVPSDLRKKGAATPIRYVSPRNS